MDDEYDVDEMVEIIPARPLSWRPFVGLALVGLSGALDELSGVVSEFGKLFLGAENYALNRERFAEEAALEIERMTGGE